MDVFAVKLLKYSPSFDGLDQLHHGFVESDDC